MSRVSIESAKSAENVESTDDFYKLLVPILEKFIPVKGVYHLIVEYDRRFIKDLLPINEIYCESFTHLKEDQCYYCGNPIYSLYIFIDRFSNIVDPRTLFESNITLSMIDRKLFGVLCMYCIPDDLNEYKYLYWHNMYWKCDEKETPRELNKLGTKFQEINVWPSNYIMWNDLRYEEGCHYVETLFDNDNSNSYDNIGRIQGYDCAFCGQYNKQYVLIDQNHKVDLTNEKYFIWEDCLIFCSECARNDFFTSERRDTLLYKHVDNYPVGYIEKIKEKQKNNQKNINKLLRIYNFKFNLVG